MGASCTTVAACIEDSLILMFMKLVQSNFIDSIAYYFGIIKSFWSIKILKICSE
jgi:hypothetical protein